MSPHMWATLCIRWHVTACSVDGVMSMEVWGAHGEGVWGEYGGKVACTAWHCVHAPPRWWACWWQCLHALYHVARVATWPVPCSGACKCLHATPATGLRRICDGQPGSRAVHFVCAANFVRLPHAGATWNTVQRRNACSVDKVMPVKVDCGGQSLCWGSCTCVKRCGRVCTCTCPHILT